MENPIPIAVQLYTLRESLSTDWLGVLAEIARIGYAGVEMAGFDYAPVSQVKQQLDELGLTVIAAHAPLPLGDEKSRVLDMMDALGCRRLICAGTGSDQFDRRDKIKARADLFNEANAVARSHSLEFGIHNHWWEFQMVDGRLAIDRLLDDLDANVFLELDTYWAAAAGADVRAFIERHAPRIPVLHIKDGPLDLDAPQVAVGDGSMTFPDLIPAATHAEWLVVELDRAEDDMLTAVRGSYAYLTRAGLARGRS